MRHRSSSVVFPLCIAILIVLGACAGLGSAQATVTPAQVTVTPGGNSPFVGNWQSTDKDLSHQTLNISHSGAVFPVLYDDDYATVCGGTPATASGPGTVASNTLTVTLSTDCLNPEKHWGNSPYTFTYAQGTDTLTDNYSVTWHRVSQFVGYWESTDKDLSHQTLFISADAAVLKLAYNDDVATVCGGKPASATGSGSPVGSVLSGTFAVDCLNPQKAWGNAPYTFTYELATDTLLDGSNITWHRVSPM